MRSLRTIAPIFLALTVGNAAPIALQNATATFSQTSPGTFNVSEAIDGASGAAVDNGWAVFNQTNSPHTAAFEAVSNVGFASGTLFTFSLFQNHTALGGQGAHGLGLFRLSVTTDDRSLFADGLQTGGDVTANWIVLTPQTAVALGGTVLTIQGDGSILPSGANPVAQTYTVTASTMLTGITGFRLEALGNPPGRAANGNFVLTEFTVDAVESTSSAIPEPSAAMLTGLGLASAFGLRRAFRRA